MRAPLHRYTWDQYVALESSSNVKHEFLEGEIYAMAGGSPEHSALAANVIGALHPQLVGGPCRVFTSDLRVRVQETGLATYPDVTVVCGEAQRDASDRNTVLNPVVIVEVLSDSTDAYDRGEKADQYRRIASLQELMLISHREPLIEVFRRRAERWDRTEARSGSTVQLTSIQATLSVDGVYSGVLVPGR